ncbi:MAG: rRNA maturation RNase YbeY [Planctomycetia bacterium]
MARPRGRPASPPSRSAIVVEVSDRQKLLRVSAGGLERLVRRALAAEGIGRAEIGIVLVDDRRIAAVHRRWLGVPGPTDVITFDLSAGAAGPADNGPLAGDIVVSTETARRMARAVGWTPRQELAYYIVHGILHLTGHDDHDPADRRAMRARERAVMKACGLPPPPRTRPAAFAGTRP